MIVLIVDDEPLVHHSFTRLTRFGHSVINAYSGLEAIRMLNVHPDIQVIVLDYEMPLIQGDFLIRKLRTNGFEGLVLANSASAKFNQILLDSGANCFAPAGKFFAVNHNFFWTEEYLMELVNFHLAKIS